MLLALTGRMTFRLAPIILSGVLCAGGAFSSKAAEQAGGQAKGTAERAAEINRVIDALNSPDPAVRLAGMEDVFARADGGLRKVAMQIALSSDDPVLRGSAVENFFAHSKHFNVNIVGSSTESQQMNSASGGWFTVRIENYDPKSGIFSSWSSHADERSDISGVKRLVMMPSDVRAGRVNFATDIGKLLVNRAGHCQGTAALDAGRPVMVGKLVCTIKDYNTIYEYYQIQIDLAN